MFNKIIQSYWSKPSFDVSYTQSAGRFTVQPIRYIPYKLPLNIEKKLLKLVDHFNYTTGSIDIIKSIDGDYIFLEFNSVGQFGMTSKPCNYFLEKKIAEYLIKKDV